MNRTRTRRAVLTAVGTGGAALAGCVGGDDTDETGEESNDQMSEGGATGWQATELEDVTTGEPFTIAQFDRPVVLHTFATWCPTCRGQQQEISRYLDDAGESAVAVDLTIDENDDAAKVRDHAESNGFDWRFGVAPAEMTGKMVDEFGRNVVSAPRSPVIIVCPNGDTQSLGKGISGDDIATAVDESC